ncbi:MAG: hypothetical protein ACE5E5_10380 [Phycisphaerae bacterium]
MLEAMIELYPWDLRDEGADAVLDRLQGEVGLTGIVLWAATPPVLQIRRRPVEPRVFRTRGGVGYPSDESHYSATRLAPPVADWVREEDMLAEVCEACARRGLGIRFVVSADTVGGNRDVPSDMVTTNAFGSESRAHLCLLNPDGQGYLQALIEELYARFAFSCLELADFGSRWGEVEAVEMPGSGEASSIARFLLGVCWCDSCMEQARRDGVDAESARGAMAHGLDRYFGQPSLGDAALRPLLSDDGPVGRYLQWQSCRFQAWFERLEGRVPRRILVRREAVHAVAGELTHCGRIADAKSVRVDAAAWDAEETVGGGSDVHVPASVLEVREADQVVAHFSRLAEAGVVCITAGNYGRMAPKTLVGIRQAVRFARRIAS